MSPTLTTPAMTQAGMILGTAAYMAPEQARGKKVDKRADNWAFGTVLFEMLTGKRAFPGEDLTDTIVAVMSKEPDFATLPATVPARVLQALRVCLRKDAKQRAGDIRDVRLALEGAFETTGPQTASVTASRRPVWIALGVALLGMIALAIPGIRHLREQPPVAPPETRLDIVTPSTGDPISFALSPDGRQVAFVASGDGTSRLWLRSLDATAAQPLAGTEGGQYPFWSPDSRSVAFFAEGRLKRLDVVGGGATQVVAAAAVPRGGTWNADGVILFTVNTTSPIFRVPAPGGQPVALTNLDRQTSHRFPFFLPDGQHFLFFALGTPDTAGIFLGVLDSPDTHRLTMADTAGVYLAPYAGTGPAVASGESGWLLWVRAGTLVGQRLDLERQALTGAPVTLADQVPFDSAVAISAVSVSAAGQVAYRTGGVGRRQLSWFDRSGKALGALGTPDESSLMDPSVSPDGHWAAVSRTPEGNTDIWLLDGTRTSRLTIDAARDFFPIWSPDGSRIVFDSNRQGHRDLYQKSSNGSGAEELLLESSLDKAANDWSPDGRFLLYSVFDPQTNSDLWVLPMEGDRTPWVFLRTPFYETAGAFSPDGRWVAYMSNESGRTEVYIRPFAASTASGATANAATGQWLVSTAGGMHPRWRRDGKELYYIGPGGEMMAAPITVTGSTLTPGAPVVLFPTRIYNGGTDTRQGRQYDVTADGRFLIDTVLLEASAPITLLMNWHPKAKKQSPPR